MIVASTVLKLLLSLAWLAPTPTTEQRLPEADRALEQANDLWYESSNLSQQGKHADAERAARDAMKIASDVYAKHPQYTRAKRALLSTRDKLAFEVFAQRRQTHLDEVLKLSSEAVALMDTLPDDTENKLILMRHGMYLRFKAGLMPAGREGNLAGRKMLEDSARYLERAAYLDDRAAPSQLPPPSRPMPIQPLEHAHVIYRELALTYAALGERPHCNAALRYALSLAPANPAVYLDIAECARVAGNNDGVGEALAQVILLEGRQSEFWTIYDNLVKNMTGSPRSTYLGAAGEQRLDLSYPVVRSHVFNAVRSRIRALIDAGQAADAQQVRDDAVQQWELPPGLLDEALREKREKVALPPPLYYRPPQGDAKSGGNSLPATQPRT